MRIVFAALWAAFVFMGSANAQAPVSVALVLAVDVSGSIDANRFQLQREGYAAAFAHPGVMEAIQGSERGRIAVTLVEWSGAGQQRVIVPWREIASMEDGEAFAALLLDQPRPFNDGSTAIGAGIAFAAQLLERGPAASRRVMDVSGDGSNNEGPAVADARDAAVARGITINGLAVIGNDAQIASYYRENVVGGPGAFVIAIADFDSFAYAIVGKIIREVAGVPPATRAAGLR